MRYGLVFGMIGMIVWSCQRDEAIQPQDRDQDGIPGTPLELDIPDYFPDMDVPADNPTTKEGVKLGRMLFYDPILSADSTISCATCHKQENAFASNVRFNRGVQGMKGARNAMSLANVGFYPRFNWHGDAESLEEQAIEPVLNPLEMTASWPDVVDRLKRHPRYPELFRQAFGDEPVSQELVTKAIAQFERTLISHNSKWDRVLKEANQTGQRVQQVAGDILSPSELRGLNLFNTERADCFHCHGGTGTQPLLTDNRFVNNGLDSMGPGEFDFPDPGRGGVTGKQEDKGKFRTPTLRNVALTGPYMHDGRFETLKEVMDFYSDGLQPAPNTSANIRKHLPADRWASGGVDLSERQKQDLINFLETFTDTAFVNNPRFSNPFEQ